MTRSLRSPACIGALLFLLAALPPLGAQAGRIPADVETVLSGGLWEAGTQEGRYRVVIRSAGFEHWISSMTVEWILNATESDTARVVSSVAIPAGPVALHDPELTLVRTGWLLTVLSTDTHFDPPRRDTIRIELGAPGIATVRRQSRGERLRVPS